MLIRGICFHAQDLDSHDAGDDPLILPEPSFRVELGGASLPDAPAAGTKPKLEETQKHSLFYKENYFGKGPAAPSFSSLCSFFLTGTDIVFLP